MKSSLPTPMFRHTYSHREVDGRHALHALAHHLPKAPMTIAALQPVHMVGMTDCLAKSCNDTLRMQKVETSAIPLTHVPMPKLPPHASVSAPATRNHVGSVKLACAFLSGKVPVAFIG